MNFTPVYHHRTATTITESLVIALSETKKIVLDIETTIYEGGQRKIDAKIRKPGSKDLLLLPPFVRSLIDEHNAKGTMRKEGWVDSQGRETKQSASTSKNEQFRELAVA